MYMARRLVRMAIEDIGLADPRALEQAIAAMQTVHFLGMPEGDQALAQWPSIFAGAEIGRGLSGAERGAARRCRAAGPNPCRCICATRRRGT